MDAEIKTLQLTEPFRIAHGVSTGEGTELKLRPYVRSFGTRC